MLIERSICTHIKIILSGEPRVLILYGPRQSGKTTILKMLLAEHAEKAAYFDGDDLRVQEIFSQHNLDILTKAIGNHQLIVIDEAQRITNIGLTLKLIFDSLQVHIVASGSSSLELAGKVSEPLTGRTTTFFLYPLSLEEAAYGELETSYKVRLEESLRFGLYPRVVTLTAEEDRQSYLIELINAYLYKDILAFDSVRKPKKVVDLLTLLSLQIGSEVSIAELSQHLALSKPIVEKYLDLLEKMFVLVNLRGFSRNLRKEVYKTSKYYFMDLGMRNALIRNFNPLHLRNDAGVLFENFCVIERQKILSNGRHSANFYFWRTYDQKEIDLIEEREGTLFGYEFKWSEKRKTPKSTFREFQQAYPQSELRIISPDTIDRLLTDSP
ncbi:MAG: ATP-binding protein [Candidatus Xenobiia bacterium LiM19]